MSSLPPRAAQALNIIAARDGVSRSTIASIMGVSGSTATVYTQLLRQLGLAQANSKGPSAVWIPTAAGLRAAAITKVGKRPTKVASRALPASPFGAIERALMGAVARRDAL